MKLFTFISLLVISVSTFGQIAEKPEDISPLLIGEKIPSIDITSADNRTIPLSEIVSKEPSILLFYRGGWCPFCNAHLAEVGEITEEIDQLGFQIIAISPDSPEKLKASLEQQELGYGLFSDADGSLTQAMGLAFRSPEKYGAMLQDYSAGENSGFLPVPALFVVDTDGTIIFEYISPDYEQRIPADLLLNVLEYYSTRN